VIPATLLGLALLAAALGPGYLYVRYASDRKPRRDQSPLQEMIEMLVIGGLAAVLSGSVILILGDATGWIDTSAIADNPGRYLVTEPARAFTGLLLFFGLAYAGAALAAHRRYRNEPKVSHGAAWHEMFYERLPVKNKHVPLLTVELKDGRKITGAVHSFTRERDSNRELVLIPPMRVQPSPNAKMGDLLKDHFLILREEDILYIAGRYSWWDKGGGKPKTAE
jgi:Family of unknown function (DUF6338)